MKNTDFTEIENALKKLRPAQTPADLSQKLRHICHICQIEKHNSWQLLLKWAWIPVSVAALFMVCLNLHLKQNKTPEFFSQSETSPSFITLKNDLLASLDSLSNEVQNTTTARTIHRLREEVIQTKKVFDENLNIQKKLIKNGVIAKEIILSPIPTYTAIMQTSQLIKQEEKIKSENNRL